MVACSQSRVTGLIQGDLGNETVTVSRLEMRLVANNTADRVQHFAGQPATENVDELRMQLYVTEGAQASVPNESYYHLAFSNLGQGISGGTASDQDYVPNNIGTLTYLTIRQGGPVEAIPQKLQAAHAGAAWLARVEDNDRRVPWQIKPGASNCFPMGNGDCFDMSSLSRSLFLSLADPMEARFQANIPLVQSIVHRLHFVPQVSHPSIGLQGQPAKGFGFIYFIQVNVPGANFQVYVPINVLFLDDGNNYKLAIDPLQLSSSESQTLGQIYVKENILGGFDLDITEGTIRSNVVAALENASLPSINPNVPFSDALLAAFGGAAGNPGSIPDNFDVFLAPTGPNRDLQDTVLWEQVTPGSVLPFNQATLIFLE
jgi:hypothetical protein